MKAQKRKKDKVRRKGQPIILKDKPQTHLPKPLENLPVTRGRDLAEDVPLARMWHWTSSPEPHPCLTRHARRSRNYTPYWAGRSSVPLALGCQVEHKK